MVVDGSFTYTPDEDFVGTDSFSYTPRDDHGADGQSATITVEVLPDPNRAPTAVDDHYSPHAGRDALGERPRRPRERRRPGRRFDHRGAVVVAFERDPEHGRRRGFTYTPDEDFVGTDLVLLHAQDDHGADGQSATITIEVLPGPEPGAVDRTGPLRHGYRRQLLVAAPGLLGTTGTWTMTR